MATGELVLLNGPPGAGKTTVARRLAARLPGTVVIHGDDLRAFAPADARTVLGPGSTYRAGGVLAAAYLAMGARLVLFDYCFLKAADVERVRDGVGAGVPLRIVTLWAPLPVCEHRADGRPGREPLGDAVAECHRLIDANRAALGQFLDCADCDPEDVARAVADAIVDARQRSR